jgi:hypothetical protein
MPLAPDDRPRAFLTCSTRTQSLLAPLLEAAEELLLDHGWRTRVPRRAAHGTASLEERRRLRTESYQEIEASNLVVHVPAPDPLAGARMHRELNHAVRKQRPIYAFVGAELREEHGIAPPARRRLDELVEMADARIVETLDDLRSRLGHWPSDPLPR